jgi:transposase
MKPVNKNRRNNAILHLKNGKSEREVARIVGLSKSTVHNINAGLENNGPKSKGGRFGKLTIREKAFCVRSMVKDGKTNATEVEQALQKLLQVYVSTSTIRRALKDGGLISFVEPKKSLLSAANVKARLSFAKAHLSWTLDDWRRVIWSDETKICRFGSDGRHYGWKRVEEMLQPKHVKQVVKHGGSSLMIWGCITYSGPGFISKIDTILDQYLYNEILETDLLESMDWYNLEQRKVIFRHDNDPKHTAKSVTQYLNDQEYTTLVWPVRSPDLNPVENIWALLKIRLFRNYDGIYELWECIQEVWNAITVEDCRKVIDTMPKRCRDVVKAKGYWIDY